jgi:hypothetical protein
MLSVMERNVKEINTELATLVFFMQGGVSFEDAHLLSAFQRKTLSSVIEKYQESMSGKTRLI